MYNTVTLLLFLTCSLLSGSSQAQTIDFKEATIPTEWLGDTQNFKVSALSELQLNAAIGSKQSSLSWNCLNTETCRWNFLIRYDFAASTTNYALFYLYSSGSDFTDKNNVSYYLKIGGIAGNKDAVELYYQKGASKYKVLESRIGIVGGTKVNCRIQIIKNAQGGWELSTDAMGGHNLTIEATANHWEENKFIFSGLSCIYSATRRDKFFWDDIEIKIPFSFAHYAFENDSVLNIHFNKSLLEIQESSLTSNINIDFKTQIKDSILSIIFNQSVDPSSYQLTIDKLLSAVNEESFQGMIFIKKEARYFVGQLRISEFMSDPSPSYGLPEIEWIEIVNTSEQSVDLNRISIADLTTRAPLPTYMLKPKDVVVICATNGCTNLSSKNCIETTSFPNLNNVGDSIFIWANDTLLIDFIHYTISMFKQDYKIDGGYAIVRKTFPENCVLSQQLIYADDVKGGSPGTISDFKESRQRAFKTSIISKNAIQIEVNGIFTCMPTYFSSATSMRYIDESKSTYSTIHQLQFNEDIEEGDLYNLRIDSIINCKNEHQSLDLKVEFVYPQEIKKGNVYINEVLYNARTGGNDFIELHNRTSKYIQVKNSYLTNTSSGILTRFNFPQDVIICPNEFIVLSIDTAVLKKQYPNSISKNLLQVKKFLSLPDTGGELFWVTSSGDTLDRILYGDAYQNLLIRYTEGFSLEKIHAEETVFNRANWTTSAAFATPGYENSQHQDIDEAQNKQFYCSPCHVSTNLNGTNDFLMLNLNPEEKASFGTINIFTISGEKVSNVIVNQLLGTDNAFQWNGIKQNGEILNDGIYIAVANWWTAEGKVYSSKIAISTSQY